MLSIAPITVTAARRHVTLLHRHLPRVQGGLFAAAVVDAAGQTRGVAIAGNPAQAWQGTRRITILRCATDGTPNACTKLYGAVCRAARALGYVEAWTYSFPDEPGTSLRAAGFAERGRTAGGEYSRPSRPRTAAIRPEPKRRWCRVLRTAGPECADGQRHVEASVSS